VDQELEILFKGVELNRLKKIDNPKGDIFHALKSTENSFVGFGEAYFSSIKEKEIKGWKKHTEMTMNIIVPVGSIVFYIFDDVLDKGISYKLGENNYKRLTIKPGYWVAFEGLGKDLNLLLNIASIGHDPLESLNLPIETFPLNNTYIK
jgi:dTDP-4-dehydrorhamnose 3,5-epimerase